MSQYEDLIRRIFDEIINAGNDDAADELMSDDFIDHGPMGDLHGRDEFKQMVAMWRSAMPDVHCEVFSVISEGDRAAWLVRTTGTHTGDMMGMSASGKRVELVSANISVIRDGRVAEHWADQSMFQFLVQIGALPMPAAA